MVIAMARAIVADGERVGEQDGSLTTCAAPTGSLLDAVRQGEKSSVLPWSSQEGQPDRVGVRDDGNADLRRAGKAGHRAQREVLHAIGRQLVGRGRLEWRDGPGTRKAQNGVNIQVAMERLEQPLALAKRAAALDTRDLRGRLEARRDIRREARMHGADP